MMYPILTLHDPLIPVTAHIALSHVTHVLETRDECGNGIVEVFFASGHREVYGTLTAAPLVAWFHAQAEQHTRVRPAMPPPCVAQAHDPVLPRIA